MTDLISTTVKHAYRDRRLQALRHVAVQVVQHPSGMLGAEGHCRLRALHLDDLQGAICPKDLMKVLRGDASWQAANKQRAANTLAGGVSL